MVSLQERTLAQMSSNPKMNIYEVNRGQRAINKAMRLFKDPEALSDLQYTNTEKKDALLIVYSYKPRLKEQFGFKLIIGDDIHGERYRRHLDNVRLLELIK